MNFRIIGEDEKQENELIEAIKRRHHHDNGSEAKLEIIDNSRSIEQKVIEEENKWKLQTQHVATRNEHRSEARKPRTQQTETDAAPAQKKKPQPIMAGCNCGRTFSAEKEENTIRITAFDNSGNVSGSYTISGNDSASYGVSGKQGESYSVSGSANEEYR